MGCEDGCNCAVLDRKKPGNGVAGRVEDQNEAERAVAWALSQNEDQVGGGGAKSRSRCIYAVMYTVSDG